MILTDYLRSDKDITWEYAYTSGVKYATIRLPDDPNFDFTNYKKIKAIYDNFIKFGITPIALEPMPNQIWESIKRGDKNRDKNITILIKLLAILDRLNIRTVCFNFMAYVGWTRTNAKYLHRGAFVTEFNLKDYKKSKYKISEKELWNNYTYFLKKVMPYAEKYKIKLALHPDDPPLSKLGGVSRIMTSLKNIKHAIYDIYPSKYLGLTFCQACYTMMGEDIFKLIPLFKDKIFMVHFRNVVGNKSHFHETFHDDGVINMNKALRCYINNNINVPIRVDHVPTYLNENAKVAGYGSIGRLYAIGYLKGLLEAIDNKEK